MFEAFETPLGARETDRTWRGMVARARREFFEKLMPVWAAMLTLVTLVLGLPSLILQARSFGFDSGSSLADAFGSSALQGSFLAFTGWLAPLLRTLGGGATGFGLEALAVGALGLFVLTVVLRSVGRRQWYHSVYDDRPQRRTFLTILLWLCLPLMIAGLALAFKSFGDAILTSPAIAAVLVSLICLVLLACALAFIYMTFSIQQPALAAVCLGAGVASAGLTFWYLLFVVTPGLRSLPGDITGPFRALATLSLFFYGFWIIVLAGSQLAVAIARRRDPIERFNNASRGEQLDFALSLIRDVEDQTRSRRWATISDLSLSMAAPMAMVTYAADKLRRAGIFEHAADGTRPPLRWAIRDDLETLTLHDLSRALGTSLEPSPGLHGRAAEDVIQGLAEREHVDQNQNLLSLFRQAPTLPAVGEPMIAVSQAAYGLDTVDGQAGQQAFENQARVIDRSAGDNGGPQDRDEGLVFVESVVEDDLVRDARSGPSAMLDPLVQAEEEEPAVLDLTQSMRIVRPSEDSLPDEEASTQAIEVPAERLGDASPLANVQSEIDNLLAPASLVPAAAPVAAMTALASWKASKVPQVHVPLAVDVEPVLAQTSWRDAMETWKGTTARAAAENALAPVQSTRSWRRESATPVPSRSWKAGPAEDRLFVPLLPETEAVEPVHKFAFDND